MTSTRTHLQCWASDEIRRRRIGSEGFIGTPYRQEIRESPDDAVIVALCARRRDLLEAAARQDQAQLVTDNWRQVVEHPDVNVGMLVLSHAPYLRKGLAPEIELHGTGASLAVNRMQSTISIARPGAEVCLLETVPDTGFGNRFNRHVFPALRAQIAGQPTASPNLEDGYRVQLFTDAAALSAKLGTWHMLAAVEATCR